MKSPYVSLFVFLFSLIASLSIAAQNSYEQSSDHDCADHYAVENCQQKQAIAAPSFRLYPNPATDVVFVEGIEMVKVWDTLGRFIGVFKTQIICADWAQGIYFAQSNNQTIKFIKQ